MCRSIPPPPPPAKEREAAEFHKIIIFEGIHALRNFHYDADINECDSTPCDVNAMCQDTNGSFVCACNSGFSGNGFTCSSKLLFYCISYSILLTHADINECDFNPCDVNAVCQNTSGSFICFCNLGFSGNGFICNSKLYFYYISYSYPFIIHVDINECDSTPCDVNAMCQDTNGSFICACNSGFSGNGFICSSKLPFFCMYVIFLSHADINECDSTPCDVNAMCQDTNGSFVCACNSGFSGNGFTCSSKLQFFVFHILITL